MVSKTGHLFLQPLHVVKDEQFPHVRRNMAVDRKPHPVFSMSSSPKLRDASAVNLSVGYENSEHILGGQVSEVLEEQAIH